MTSARAAAPPDARDRPISAVIGSTSGAVFVEYILVAMVGLIAALALAAIGPTTVRFYSMQRAALYQSYP